MFPLEVELRDDGVEAEIDVLLRKPRRIVDEGFFGGWRRPAEDRGEETGAVVGEGDFGSDEHDRTFAIMLPDAFTYADSANTGSDDKVVATNHFPDGIARRTGRPRDKIAGIYYRGPAPDLTHTAALRNLRTHGDHTASAHIQSGSALA